MNKRGILVAIFGLITLTAAGDEYTDSLTNVVYTYHPYNNSACVKAGRTYIIGGYGEELTEEVEPGSPKATGDIAIQEMLVIDGQKYTINSIGEYAFYLSQITKVVIPRTILSIGVDAFAFSDLVSVVSYIEEPFDTDAFRYLNTSNIILYVPNGCGIKYKTVKGWSYFNNIVEMDTTDFQFTINNEQIFPKDPIFNLNGQPISNMYKNSIYIKGKRKYVK